MSDYPAAAVSQPGEPRPQLRAAALTAVIAGLVLLAGAAFVLSYQGIHQIALNAGVTPELARLYPVILDAMLVMSCAAALALRTAGVWTRCYVWGCLILLLAALAAGNAVYAMSISLPAQPTRAVVAVLPWALLLMGFGMLLAMLRHWRRIRVASAGPGPARPGDDVAAGATPGAVSWAGSPGGGPAKQGAPRSGIEELMEPRTGQPPERAVAAAAGTAAAGTAGARAAIAGAEADGKRPGPATLPESTGASQEDSAPRPSGTPAKQDPGMGPAASDEAEPAAPAGTAGPARTNGPAGATPPVDGTRPAPATQPGAATQPSAATQAAEGTQPAAATQPAGGTKPDGTSQPGAATQAAEGTQPAAATQPAGDTQPAGGTQPDGTSQPGTATQAAEGTQPATTARTTAPAQAPTPPPAPAASPGTAGTTGPTGPAPTATPPGGNFRLVTPPAGTAPTATPPARTVPTATPPADAPAAAPFLDRILSGPTNPNAPEADDG